MVLLFALAWGGPLADAGELNLSWTDNADNESGFKVERSSSGTTFAEVATVGSNVTSFVDSSLTPGATYWYRVRAYNSGGDSDYTNVASATVPNLLASESNLTISSISDLTLDGASGSATFSISNTDTSGGALNVVVTSSNQLLVPDANLVVDGSGADRTISVNPAPDQTGASTITVTVSNGVDSVSASFVVNVPVALASEPEASRLINLSSRGMVSDGDPMIAGFSVGGEGQQTILIRAVGKSLEKFGITDGLGEPVISIVPSKTGSTTIQTDGGWGDAADLDALTAAMVEAGAFKLENGSKDAAILLRVDPGLYTAVVQDTSRKGGTCLVEVYALDDDLQIVSGRLLNLSSRGYVGNGKDVLIAGLVISGEQRQRVLIRGIGPTLAKLGVSSPVSDPQIQIFAAGGAAFASNDDWSANADEALVITQVSATVGAFSLAQGSADAAMVLDLDPGLYTVHLSPARGQGGTGLVEVYVVP